MTTKTHSSWIKLLATQLAILLVACFAIGEIYFRIKGSFVKIEWPSGHDAKMGFLFKPGSTVKWTNHLDYWVSSQVNSLGFTDREPPTQAQAQGACRIAVIGDSFVEAVQVAQEKRFPHALERLWSKKTGDRDSLIAMGFGYSGTGQGNQIPFLEAALKALKPHLVILLFVANDITNNAPLLEAMTYGWHPDHLPRPFVTGDKVIPAAADWEKWALKFKGGSSALGIHTFLNERSAFYAALMSLAPIRFPGFYRAMAGGLKDDDSYRQRLEFIRSVPGYADRVKDLEPVDGVYPDLSEPYFYKNLLPIFSKSLTHTQDTLTLIKKKVEQSGAKMKVFVAANVVDQRHLAPKDRVPRGQRFYLDPIFAKLGIETIDHWDYLQRHKITQQMIEFAHDGHWSAFGHQTAADATREYLEQHPLKCAP